MVHLSTLLRRPLPLRPLQLRLAPPAPGRRGLVVHHAARDRARSRRRCELRRPRGHEAAAHHAAPVAQLARHAPPTVGANGAAAAHVVRVRLHAEVKADVDVQSAKGLAVGALAVERVLAGPAVLVEAHVAKVLVAVGAAVGLRRDVVAAVAVPLGDRHVAVGAPPAGGANVRVRRRRGRALRVRRVRPPAVLAVWAAQPARAAAAAAMFGGDIGPRRGPLAPGAVDALVDGDGRLKHKLAEALILLVAQPERSIGPPPAKLRTRIGRATPDRAQTAAGGVCEERLHVVGADAVLAPLHTRKATRVQGRPLVVARCAQHPNGAVGARGVAARWDEVGRLAVAHGAHLARHLRLGLGRHRLACGLTRLARRRARCSARGLTRRWEREGEGACTVGGGSAAAQTRTKVGERRCPSLP